MRLWDTTLVANVNIYINKYYSYLNQHKHLMTVVSQHTGTKRIKMQLYYLVKDGTQWMNSSQR
jgi:hypothetical protein